MEDTTEKLAAEVARLKEELAVRGEHIAYLEKKVGIDELTGAPNRFAFNRALLQALRVIRGEVEEHRAGAPLTHLALIMLDLDHFKNINDTYGHPIGDLVLRRVAECLMKSVRGEDVVARLGGEEFVVLLRGADEMVAERHAQELRTAFEAMTFPEREGMHITASFGVVCSRHSTDPARLEELVDQALYQAKEAGRNCVKVYEA